MGFNLDFLSDQKIDLPKGAQKMSTLNNILNATSPSKTIIASSVTDTFSSGAISFNFMDKIDDKLSHR